MSSQKLKLKMKDVYYSIYQIFEIQESEWLVIVVVLI